MAIQAILFDADGVIQRPLGLRRAAWQTLVGPERDVDEFVEAVFKVEEHALEGRSDFIGALSGLLLERQCPGTLQDALAAWTMIEPDSEMTDVVRVLRQGGIRCYLGTNQEPHRASYMSEQLGYSGLFDQEFYSCRMGIAKPAPAYFHSIVETLDLPPTTVLFLDDREVNVSSAREAGLNAVRFQVDSGPLRLEQALRDFGVHVV